VGGSRRSKKGGGGGARGKRRRPVGEEPITLYDRKSEMPRR